MSAADTEIACFGTHQLARAMILASDDVFVRTAAAIVTSVTDAYDGDVKMPSVATSLSVPISREAALEYVASICKRGVSVRLAARGNVTIIG